MNWRRVTWIGMLAIVAVVIAWDVVLGALHQDTESMIIAEAGRSWTVLPYLGGALIGHWFANRKWAWGGIHYEWWPFAVGSVALVFGLDAVHRWVGWPAGLEWVRYPGLWAVLGMGAGSFLWPQRLPDEWGRRPTT